MGKWQRPVDVRDKQQAKPAEQPAAEVKPKRPTRLPPGATMWSKSYVTADGRHATAKTSVPIDDAGRIVAVDLWCCPTEDCGHETWASANSRHQPMCRTHDVPLVKTDPEDAKTVREPMLPWDAMWQRIALPARAGYGLAAEVLVGGLLEAGHTGPAPALLLGAATTAGGYAATRVYLTKRGRKHGRIEDGQVDGRRMDTIRLRARIAAYMGAQFGAAVTAAASVDPHTLVGKAVWAAVAVTWAAAWVPWWRYQDQQRNRPEETPTSDTPTEQTIDEDPDRAAAEADARTWTEDVAAQCPGLGHTRVDVDTWTADEGGRRMILRASRGGITDETMRQALPAIAGAYGVPRAAVGWVCEYSPTPEEKGSPRSVLLLIQPRSPLNQPVPGKPVDILPLDNAVVHMGMRIDGSDLVTRLWTPGWGAPSRLLLGTKGSGKTATVRRLILVQLKARVINPNTGKPVRLIAPFGHDPKRGADYGLFRRLMCGFSVSSDTLHMIVDAFTREMDRRYDMLGSTVWEDDQGRLWEGERPFDPSTMGPILALDMDELHVDAKDQALMAKLEPFGRKMRAAGIEVNGATHASTIGDTGSQAFRDMLAGGEAWLLRTTMGLNAALATGGQLVGDPRALPRTPGMLLHAAGEDATMQCRAAFDEPHVMYDQLYGPNRTPLIQPVEFPPETLEAFGRDFVAWMRECQESALGSPVPGVPKTLQVGAAASGRDVNAEEALRQILFTAGGPLKREEIAAHALWAPRSVTSTLTKTLRAGQDANPPWLIKVKEGVYDLTLPERQRLLAAADEAKETAAA